MNSALEGTVLAVLCITLYLVLRRRRVLRAAATTGPSGRLLFSRPCQAGADLQC